MPISIYISINFHALVLKIQCSQKFRDIHAYIHKDRHFLKMVKSCSRCFKTYKSIENRVSKIFTNSIFSSHAYQRKKNGKFRVLAIICFWFIFISFTHTHKHRAFVKNMIFGFKGHQYARIYQILHFEDFISKNSFCTMHW